MIDGVLDYNAPATVRVTGRMPGRLRAIWRLWRIRHARRAMLRAMLAETSDPRLVEDVGLTPEPNGLELFARALLQQRR